MSKINRFIYFSLGNNNSNQGSQKDNLGDAKIEKVLCNHCGRTARNGIRCLGICVADNEY